jgi:hypothetical protein
MKEVKFSHNYGLESLIEIRDTQSHFELDSVSFFNNFAVEILFVSYVDEVKITRLVCSENGKYLSSLISTSELNHLPGPCLELIDYTYAHIINTHILNNFAVSSMPGISFVHTTKTDPSLFSKIKTSIKDFNCADNYIMNNNSFLKYSANCLFFNVKGFADISNSKINNNVIAVTLGAAYGGNPCLNSVGISATMKIVNCSFSGNKAFAESMCLKFDGYSIDIRDSLFEFNAGVKEELYVGAEGGCMNLGPDNMFIKNVTMRNITSAKGGGIFFHNRFLKKFQTVDASDLVITFNYGIQTSGLEFDGSLLTGKLVFTNCSINDNRV